MNTKVKKILKISANVLLWLFVAFSAFLIIMVISSKGGSTYEIANVFGKGILTIQSDSMNADYSTSLFPDGIEPEGDYPKKGFKEGDILFVKKITGSEALQLKKGDVITFIDEQNGVSFLNTHRIIEDPFEDTSGFVIFTTQGDNRSMSTSPSEITHNDIVAVWSGGKIGGVGKVIDFLNTQVGFMICIVLPLAAFFLFELVNFIKIVVAAKVTAGISKDDEEEIKRRAVEEYLKQQQEAEKDKDKDK